MLTNADSMSPSETPLPAREPVLIADGGRVGLTVAALLAGYGIPSLTVEADDGYCAGRRAVCMSRLSQEVIAWVGADQPLLAMGLSWPGTATFAMAKRCIT